MIYISENCQCKIRFNGNFGVLKKKKKRPRHHLGVRSWQYIPLLSSVESNGVLVVGLFSCLSTANKIRRYLISGVPIKRLIKSLSESPTRETPNQVDLNYFLLHKVSVVDVKTSEKCLWTPRSVVTPTEKKELDLSRPKLRKYDWGVVVWHEWQVGKRENNPSV